MKKFFQKNKKAQKLLYISAVFFFCSSFLLAKAQEGNLDFGNSQKRIVLQDEGMSFESTSGTQTVEEFLNEKKSHSTQMTLFFLIGMKKSFLELASLLRGQKRLWSKRVEK